MKLLVRMAALVAVALLLTALPFLPGHHDRLAVPLSGMAYVLGVGSMLLVPIGLIWFLYERTRGPEGPHRGRRGLVLAALGVGSLPVFASAILAFDMSGAALAVGVLVAWGLTLWRRGPRLLEWAGRPGGRDLARPAVLVFLPVVVAGAQLLLAGPLTSFAWGRTMDGVAPLIADIERYRETNGHSPRSLFAEWCDYRPEVIGVRGYQYEPTGDAYSIAVEVPSFTLDSRVFLVYNPADRHAMVSHDAFLLRHTAEELVNYRGYHSARPLDRPHWAVLFYD